MTFWILLAGLIFNFLLAAVLAGTNWGQTEGGKRTIIICHLLIVVSILGVSAWLP